MVDSALRLDRNYAQALATKGWMLKVLAGAYASTAAESRALYRQAETTVRRAIQIAPQSRYGHAVLGDILYEQLNPRPALGQYEKMMALPGEDSNALRGYAVFLGEIRRTAEALALVDRAIAADPLNGQSYGWKGYILWAARRYPEAIEAVRQQIELSPRRNGPRMRVGYYLTLMGKYAEAAAALNVPGPFEGGHLVYHALLAIRTGKPSEAEAILGQLRKSDFAHFQAAQVLAQLGRKDEDITTLESAWKSRDSGLTTVLIDPLLDPLRGNARFEAIVKRIDFPT
jgi:tetratricopeptide (TPR) repeat protein